MKLHQKKRFISWELNENYLGWFKLFSPMINDPEVEDMIELKLNDERPILDPLHSFGTFTE